MRLDKITAIILIFYPAVSVAEDQVSVTGSIVKSLIFLLLLFASGVLLKKKLGTKVFPTGERELEVKEIIPLSPKTKLAIVKYGNVKLLLGISDSGITKIKEEDLEK